MKKASVLVLGLLLVMAFSFCQKQEAAPEPAPAPEAAAPAPEPAPAPEAAAPAPAAAGDTYAECRNLSIAANTKTSQGNMPDSALQQAADTTCAICQQDAGGEACKAVVDQLKTQQ